MRLFAIFFLLLAGCSVMPPLERPTLKTPLADNALETGSSKQKQNLQTVLEDAPPNLIWPLKDGVVTQEFRFKKKGKKRRGHKGVDISAPKGDDIYAAHDGLVVFAGRQFRGYGKLIIIENDDGNWATFYSHLSKIKAKAGQKVSQGDLIGHVGRTGRATGYHLHFEVRYNKEPINPLTVLP